MPLPESANTAPAGLFEIDRAIASASGSVAAIASWKSWPTFACCGPIAVNTGG